MKDIISRKLQATDQAIAWGKNIPEAERLSYKKSLIDIRRELKRIEYAVSERCSTAAFGESQMGKSYLVSAILSTPETPFSVTDGENGYNFISEINPSAPNSTIEATGVITRFTIQKSPATPQGFLRVQLLSVPDIILILCEAYYNQIDYSHEDIIQTSSINEIIGEIVPNQDVHQTLLSEDEILDIQDYLKSNSSIQKKCNDVLQSDLFNYLILNSNQLNNSQVSDIIQLLWNRDRHISKLWNDLLDAYNELRFTPTIYARFDAVLKRKGTLLDVARLDEMYSPTTMPEAGDYDPMAVIKLTPESNEMTVRKSFLSALIAELCFVLPAAQAETRPFLNHLDILDFPGARRPEEFKPMQLEEGKNLSTALRRGKVTFLFNKYSNSRRINTLLFCHNNNQSAQSTMGSVLDTWVKSNVGEDEMSRQRYMDSSSIAPLFIIGTWFNKDLEYQREAKGDDLNERWVRRFNTVLEKEVLKSYGDEEHWFNSWCRTTKPFRNIYMLRDFKYSTMIYSGYDPDRGTPEGYDPDERPGRFDPVRPEKYPDFFSDLKQSFINNEFVKLHISNPEDAWRSAATCANDGTSRIIANLNAIAQKIAKARDEKFRKDLEKTNARLLSLLEIRHHPESSDEQLKIAKRQAVDACLQLRKCVSGDASVFGRLMDKLMISRAEIYELAFSEIIGKEQAEPWTDYEAQLILDIGIDSNMPREWNINRLCDYLGVDTEQECRATLERQGDDMDRLLSSEQLMVSKADLLVESVENLWHDKVLMKRCSESFQSLIPSIGTIMATMWSVYQLLRVRTVLTDKVKVYLDTLSEQAAIGIISDYLAMQYNAFCSSFGYAFMSEAQRQNVISKNNELRLGLDEEFLKPFEPIPTLQFLEGLSRQKEILRSRTRSQEDNAFLNQYPQFQCLKRWEQQLRIGYVFGSDLPSYDIKANNELGNILNLIRQDTTMTE